MLYRKFQTKDESTIGIWKMDETESELLSGLENKSFLEKDILCIKSETRRIEKLATRVLLKQLIGYEVNIGYKSSGKPFIINSQLNISISHTKNYIAIILDKNKIVGIDIEQISEKVKKVSSKFISDNEYIDSQNETIHLLLHWSAKETVYKMMDKSGIDLIDNLHVDKFKPTDSGTFSTSYTKDSLTKVFKITYECSEDFVLTYTNLDT